MGAGSDRDPHPSPFLSPSLRGHCVQHCSTFMASVSHMYLSIVHSELHFFWTERSGSIWLSGARRLVHKPLPPTWRCTIKLIVRPTIIGGLGSNWERKRGMLVTSPIPLFFTHSQTEFCWFAGHLQKAYSPVELISACL